MKIQEKFLTPNKYSRPGIKLEKVTKIAVHYVGNPGSTAIANRNYFENLRITKDRYVSSHFIVGLDGEVIQCIPLDEWSYCTNQANGYSISIECCHPDSSGKFTEATEKSLTELCAYLCGKFGLDPMNDIIRHYDVTGKLCPRYWSPADGTSLATANARFTEFKKSVAAKISKTDNISGNGLTLPYTIRVLDPELNVRKAPGTSNEIVYKITNNGIYTIVKIQLVGNVEWGLLKSGIGWINLGEKYVIKLDSVKSED